MSFTLADWMVYTMCGVLGLMSLDLLIQLVKSVSKGSFDLTFVLDYLKDVLYYVMPLTVLLSLFDMDPTGWVLVIFYFLGGLAVMVKYLTDIIHRFKK
jgi:hypothetical protein